MVRLLLFVVLLDLQLEDRDNRPIHVVHVALSRLKDLKDVPFSSFHASVNSIETYFNIAPGDQAGVKITSP